MTNQPISIYCINLPRAIERKQKITREWIDKLGLEIEFVEAVDRRDLIKPPKSPISEGEIACILSHNKTYEHILKKQETQALIIEDDAVPLFSNKQDLFNVVSHYNLEFPDTDVCILQNIYGWKNQNFSFVEKKEYTSLLKGNPFGTHGYIIKLSGIHFIRPHLLAFAVPIDHLWDQFAASNKLAIANHPLIKHPVWSEATTYINRRNDKRKKFIE